MNVVNLSGKFLRSFLVCVAIRAATATAQETNLPPTIGFGQSWQYWNREMAPLPGWKSLEYNSSLWTLGTAQLGYGDGDEATVTQLEPAPPHPATAYFRKHFFVGSPGQFSEAQIRLIRDDGAVVYINGVEVARDGMPGGEVGHNTLAAVNAGGDENTPRTHLVNISNLLRHTNVIAVEVHQVAVFSTDMSFDLELRLAGLPVEERPVVSIVATQPNTSEPLPNALVVPGEFAVFRDDPHLDQPLNVYLTYSGSATSADYEPLPIAVLFPAGSNAVKIPVFATTDGLVEGPESVVARLGAMPVEFHDPRSPNRPYIQSFSNFVAEVTIQDAFVPGTNVASIRVQQPQDGAVFQVGQPIEIFATAIDPNGYIPRLEFFANDLSIGVSEIHFLLPPPPGTPIQHSIVWSNAPMGRYEVTAIGVDSLDQRISSPPIHLVVTNTPRPGPVVGVLFRPFDYPVFSGSEAATGMFEFYRIGETNEALQVFFDKGGTATPGLDYVSFNNYIVFAPGSTRTNIALNVIEDSLIEGVETVTVDLEPAPLGVDSLFPTHYIIDPTNELATVTILDDESTNSEPRVVIRRPTNGSNFPTGMRIPIDAWTFDPAGYIPRVDFYAGEKLIGTSRIDFIVPPPPGTPLGHVMLWSNAPAGTHMITARGHSNRRFTVDSAPIQITVGAEERLTIAVEAVDPAGWEALTNGFPDSAHFRISRVSGPLSQPVNVRFTLTGSATYGIDYQQIPNTVTLSSNEPSRIVAIAPIPDNLVEGNESVVLTLTNCTLVAPLTLHPFFPPFPICYDIAVGRHRAEVVIRDAPVGSNQPPHVTIIAPHDGAVFEQGERVHFRAEASDSDGRIIQLNMLMDGSIIASTNTFILANSIIPPAGEHALVASALDDDGFTNLSQRVRILVRGTNNLAFFERQLPAGFTPGTPFTVRIQARVPSGTQAWGVEDLPPPGWNVASISDGGIFDAATGKVKFGHFLEAGTRTLSYVVRPPIGNGGTNQFVGTFTGVGSIDGRNYPILGQSTVSSLASEFHPADRNEDRRIVLAEVTGYAAAWKLGETWPAGPNPIPASYVTRAGLIWRQGEAYRFAATNPPPFCWVPLAGREGVFLAASASTATRSISGGPEVSSPRVVTLEVEPAASVTAYNVEERVPEGWTVRNITGDGVLDPIRGVVRWGLYLDSEERTLSYELVPPDGIAAAGQLLGEVTLDGEVLTFAGADSVVSVDPATPLRLQSTELTGDGGVKMKLGGAASQICVLESSSDLVNWGFVAELFLPDGELEFRDSDVGETQQRYYRLRAR